MDSERIYLFRYITLIAVVSSLIGSVIMFLTGVQSILTAIVYFFEIEPFCAAILPETLTPDVIAMVMLIKSVDQFLFGLVLLIFGFGIYQLFVSETPTHGRTDLPPWRRIRSVSQLKKILAEVIIVILFVLFLEESIIESDTADTISTLFIPISILLLSAALYLLRQKESGEG
jgi:uncharacterized membrane protein YqhA